MICSNCKVQTSDLINCTNFSCDGGHKLCPNCELAMNNCKLCSLKAKNRLGLFGKDCNSNTTSEDLTENSSDSLATSRFENEKTDRMISNYFSYLKSSTSANFSDSIKRIPSYKTNCKYRNSYDRASFMDFPKHYLKDSKFKNKRKLRNRHNFMDFNYEGSEDEQQVESKFYDLSNNNIGQCSNISASIDKNTESEIDIVFKNLQEFRTTTNYKRPNELSLIKIFGSDSLQTPTILVSSNSNLLINSSNFDDQLENRFKSSEYFPTQKKRLKINEYKRVPSTKVIYAYGSHRYCNKKNMFSSKLNLTDSKFMSSLRKPFFMDRTNSKLQQQNNVYSNENIHFYRPIHYKSPVSELKIVRLEQYSYIPGKEDSKISVPNSETYKNSTLKLEKTNVIECQIDDLVTLEGVKNTEDNVANREDMISDHYDIVSLINMFKSNFPNSLKIVKDTISRLNDELNNNENCPIDQEMDKMQLQTEDQTHISDSTANPSVTKIFPNDKNCLSNTCSLSKEAKKKENPIIYVWRAEYVFYNKNDQNIEPPLQLVAIKRFTGTELSRVNLPIQNAFDLLIDRKPIICPISMCEQDVFISDFCKHIKIDHPKIPIETIWPGVHKNFFIDPHLNEDGVSRCNLLYLLGNKIQDLGSNKYKNFVPMLVMTAKLNYVDLFLDNKKQNKVESGFKALSKEEFLLIWMTGLSTEKLPIYYSIVAWSETDTRPECYLSYSGKLYSYRNSQNVSTMFRNGNALLISYEQCRKLTNDNKNMVQLQVLVH